MKQYMSLFEIQAVLSKLIDTRMHILEELRRFPVDEYGKEIRETEGQIATLKDLRDVFRMEFYKPEKTDPEGL